MKRKAVKKNIFLFISILFLVLFGINLGWLDYIIIKNALKEQRILGDSTMACPSSCLAAINKLGSGGSVAKEYFVPMGTGTNATNDWADVVGASATVDTAQYPRIKKVVFEATLAVPTGNEVAYVRLFNQTDGHPVWFSELSMNTAGPILLISQPITLDKGSKLYQIQMKTQLQYPANLTQGRIHIVTY
jgi:hypothetical protein